MNTLHWIGLGLMTAAVALAAVPGVAAVDAKVNVETNGIPATGLWVVDCTNQFISDAEFFLNVEIDQITHEVLLDLTSYVSDTGYFAGHEVIVTGQYIDCLTL